MSETAGQDGEGPLFEALAAVQHDIWAHWMRYLLETKSYAVTQEPTGRGLREADVQHWRRQIDTPYAELSEAEKASDREQVEKFWAMLPSGVDRDRIASLVRSAHGRGVEGAPAPTPDEITRATS